MSDIVIKAENLSKKYIIGHQREERYTTLRDSIVNGAKGLLKPFQRGQPQVVDPNSEEFWALKDVSFEIKQGDRVGIIGRNGAGKSTLLKILSRITEPTEGRIKIKGRVASLLEVGTGFHPELTGRENIFLNGAILGMGREEIKKKFDEIVAFAEVEKFLDTPVKRYSSGMYVRLAFAVAAHLESEILIVDEVLAVGDMSFQEKCLGKMQNISSSGRTVLFVSHNIDSIRRLCSSGLYLQSGSVRDSGRIEDVTNTYLTQFSTGMQGNIIPFPAMSDSGYFIEKIEILEIDASPKKHISTWDSVRFRISFYCHMDLNAGSVELRVSTLSGNVLMNCSTQPDSNFKTEFKEGMNSIDCIFPKFCLSAGRYLIGAGLAIPNVEWLYQQLDCGIIEIFSKDVYHSGLAPASSRYLLPLEHQWESVQVMNNVASI